MKVLLPWNMASYIPLNGFHPLYKVVTEVEFHNFSFEIPKKKLSSSYFQYYLKWEHEKLHTTWSVPNFIKQDDLDLNWQHYLSSTERRVPGEFYYVSFLPADIEFHHTAPLTMGERPFLLHIESFMPTFFPFLQQGKMFNSKDLEKVIPVYKGLFESDKCLGIYSHIPETIEQLSDFFGSKIIDKKLHQTPIALSKEFISKKIEKNRRRRVIFLSSAHQGNTFYLRGGFVVLDVALKLLRKGYDIEFFFRCTKPEIEEFDAYDLNFEEIASYENKNIFWDERFLEQKELNNLIASSDFLAIPSVNLHSVSIMSSMANGVIPIVSDTIGTDVYVKDQLTGIVLKGVREKVWKKSPEFNFFYDDHNEFRYCHENLVEQMELRLEHLLNNESQIRCIQQSCIEISNQKFASNQFRDWVLDLFNELSQNQKKLHYENNDYFNDNYTRQISESDFGGPTDKKLIDYRKGRYSILRLANQYLFVPDVLYNDFLNNKSWSYMSIFHACNDDNHNNGVKASLFDKLPECKAYARSYSIRRGIRAEHIIIGTADFLRKWPYFYFFVRSIWRMLKSIRSKFS